MSARMSECFFCYVKFIFGVPFPSRIISGVVKRRGKGAMASPMGLNLGTSSLEKSWLRYCPLSLGLHRGLMFNYSNVKISPLRSLQGKGKGERNFKNELSDSENPGYKYCGKWNKILK